VKLRRISQTIRSHRWFGKKKREIIFRFTSLLIQLGILFRFNSRGSSRLSPCAWVLTYVPPSHSLRQTSRRQRKKKKRDGRLGNPTGRNVSWDHFILSNMKFIFHFFFFFSLWNKSAYIIGFCVCMKGTADVYVYKTLYIRDVGEFIYLL
jgi:hypothetical protein